MATEPGLGCLIVCGTPIGNLDDAPPRLARTLAEADLVACEDTRHTRRLLDHLGVRARTVAHHDLNERTSAAGLADRIADGDRVALVTDAGMPTVSDPGYRLVQECVARGLRVTVVPGPSAALAALAVSGLPTDRFCFEGFLPRKAGARVRRLAELATEPRTMVFFEAPHRVAETLEAMAEAFGPERAGVLTRELTKLFEEVRRGTLGELHVSLAGAAPKGELTLVVAGATPVEPESGDLAARVAELVADGHDRKDAITTVARATGAPRRTVYQAVLDAKDAKDDATDGGDSRTSKTPSRATQAEI